MDEQRKRLIKLITAYYHEVDIGLVSYFTEKEAEPIADYLLANGVLVLPCRIGDALFYVVDDDNIDPTEDRYVCENEYGIVCKEEGAISVIAWNGTEFGVVDSVNEFMPLGGQFALLSAEDAERWMNEQIQREE